MRWSKKSALALGLAAISWNLTACKVNKTEGAQQVRKAKAIGTPVMSAEEKARRASMTPSQLCYQDLCVSSRREISMADLLEKASVPSDAQKKYYEEHVTAHVNKMIASQSLAKRNLLDHLSEKEKDFAAATLNPGQERLIKSFYMLMHQAQLPERTQKNMSQKMANQDFVKAHSLGSVKGPSEYLKSLYPNMELAQAAKAEAELILKKQEEINSRIAARIIDLDHGATGRINSGEAFTSEDLASLVTNSYAIRWVSWMSQEDNELTTEFTLSQEQIKNIYHTSKLKDKISARLNNMPLLAKTCESRFYQSMNLYPQAADVENFKTVSEKVRTQVLGMLSPQDPAFNIVQKAKIYMPRDLEAVARKWTTELNDRAKADLQDSEKFKTLDASSTLLLGTLLSMAYSESDNTCEDIAELTISDATHTVDTGIKASWLSVKRPAHGISILAHEFAHLVSKYSNQFSAQKACLKDKQGGNQFVEEDFADQIAGQISLQLQNSANLEQANYGCLFASMEATPSLKVTNTTDTHSSGLFRALQIARLRKQVIPESCKMLVTQEAPKALESCE